MSKIYKVKDTYYNLDLIYSMSEVLVYKDSGIAEINGKEIKWNILYSHYKPEYQQKHIDEDETLQEYNKMFNAFRKVNNEETRINRRD